VFSGVFIAEEFNGVGYKGHEIPQQFMYTLGGIFEPVPEICLFH
jgi:hypothetical protein